MVFWDNQIAGDRSDYLALTLPRGRSVDPQLVIDPQFGYLLHLSVQPERVIHQLVALQNFPTIAVNAEEAVAMEWATYLVLKGAVPNGRPMAILEKVFLLTMMSSWSRETTIRQWINDERIYGTRGEWRDARPLLEAIFL